MKKEIFTGSGVALITPMNNDGSINYELLSKLIEFQINNKTDAIITCGTTGEAATMTCEEHLKVIDFTVNKVAGRIPVIAGAGSNNTAYALKISKEAENIGVDGILSVTPYYNKTSQSGLVNHFTYIADNINTPIILYNVPSRTGCNIKPETYAKLAKHENIVGIKEANGDISSVAKTISLCGDDISVYSGNDDQIVPILSLGGKGVISVLANVCPEETHYIVEKYLSGKTNESLNLQLKYIKLIEALFSDVNPIPVKEAMNLMGFSCGKCRMPLAPLNKESYENLKVTLNEYGLIK